MKKSRKAAFEPKTFLAKVGDGKTITEYYKDYSVANQPRARTSGSGFPLLRLLSPAGLLAFGAIATVK